MDVVSGIWQTECQPYIDLLGSGLPLEYQLDALAN
jgi:hypothetical protein